MLDRRRTHALRAAVAAAALLAGVLAGAPAVQAAPTGQTWVTMVSEPGDPIGRGTSQLFRPGNASVAISHSSASGVRVDVTDGATADSYTLAFEAPVGQTLAVGTYDDAREIATVTRPAISISGAGSGCSSTGRFTVHELERGGDGAIDRLALTYVQHCDSRYAALYGEVRVAASGGDTRVRVAPAAVKFPDRHPGVAGRITPIHVDNTSGQQTGIDSVTLSGVDPTSFAVVGNTCGTLEAGASCRVDVRFKPTAAGERSAVLTLAFTGMTGAGSRQVLLRGDGIPGHTSFAMDSDVGDYIGQGRAYSYTPLDSQITASGSEAYAEFRIASGDESWDVAFEAGPNDVLAPGAFLNVTRARVGGAGPGLAVYGEGRGCNEVEGSFTIYEAVFANGTVERFSATFEQHCEGMEPALRGSIAYRASDPARQVDGTSAGSGAAPPQITGLRAHSQIGAAALSWTDPTSTSYAETVVRAAVGNVAPATVTSGFPVYVGTDGGVLVNGLDPGESYSFAFFTRSVTGATSAPKKTTLRGTVVFVAANPSTIRYGSAAPLGVALVTSGGTGIPNAEVVVYSRPSGTHRYSRVGVVVTDSDGRAGLQHRPTVNTEYAAHYFGANTSLGSISTPFALGVRPRVTATLGRSSVALGASTSLSTSVIPAHPGHSAYLQRHYSGAWHTVSRRTLDGSSAASWTLRPDRRGTYTYRVVKRADRDHALGYSRAVTLTVG